MAEMTDKHASVKLYWVFAGILSVITFVEWWIFKHESIRSQTMIFIPTLIALSITKFMMVCGWYMHLRYDHKWLLKIFVSCILLSSTIFAILHLALHRHSL